MVMATALWGATFVIVRDAVVLVPPVTIVAARFTAAAALLAAVVAAQRRPVSRAALLGGAFTGVLTAGGYLFQAVGLQATSAGTSAFLTCAGTLTAGLFAWPLLGQRPGARIAAGLALAVTGSALLSLRSGLHVGIGEAWTLLGAVVYALQIVAVARWAGRVDPVVLTMIQAATVGALLLPWSGGWRALAAVLDPAGAARLAYLIVAGSVVAPLLQILAQRSLPPARVGLLFALEPVFALLFAVTLGGERFVARWWLGAALIVFAVVWVEWRPARSPAATAGTAP